MNKFAAYAAASHLLLSIASKVEQKRIFLVKPPSRYQRKVYFLLNALRRQSESVIYHLQSVNVSLLTNTFLRPSGDVCCSWWVLFCTLALHFNCQTIKIIYDKLFQKWNFLFKNKTHSLLTRHKWEEAVGAPCGFSRCTYHIGERGNGKAWLFRKSSALALDDDLPRHFLKAYKFWAKTVKAQ